MNTLYTYIIILVIVLLLLLNIFRYKKEPFINSTTIPNTIIPNTTIPNTTIPNDELYKSPSNDDTKPIEIKKQIALPANQLNSNELAEIDSNILRQNRTLKKFSMTDELDMYQMYNVLKQQKEQNYKFNFNTTTKDTIKHKDNTTSKVKKSETLINKNSGEINKVDLDLFTRLKLEIITAFNILILNLNYYVEYHPYHFFKIINSNLISSEIKDVSRTNYIFTLTLAREYKYQQFIVYYDIDLIKTNTNNNSNNNSNTNSNSNTNTNNNINNNSNTNYKLVFNKIELRGVPVPKTVEFHKNSKVELDTTLATTKNNLEKEELNELNKYKEDNYYYKDQISDNAEFDVLPNDENSKLFQRQNTKFINTYERTDMDSTLLDESSVSAKIDEKMMSIAKDQQYKNHKCFGLVDGISNELPQYNNPLFCKSYHPEINQKGVWDAPCQIDNDCPFYNANKNYPNNKGKCNKETGMCEMPMGVIPIGFTKYGKVEPECYNCSILSLNNKCCKKQSEDIAKGNVYYKSPDYIFNNDEKERKQYKEELETMGLKVNPSI